MTHLKARRLAREFFPTWSRRARAKWVLAKMAVAAPKVGISSHHPHNPNDYFFARCSK